ncbi:MAG: hypothetical protein WA354_17305 [Terracidiphilus sp.]
MIERIQGQIDKLRGYRKPPTADFIEGVFQAMRKSGERIEAKHGSRAFDGVEGTEGASDQFHIVAMLIQFKEGGLKVDKDLARFFAKGDAKLISTGW